MKDYEYTIIRSSRKTLGMEVTRNGLLVRAPRRATIRQIESFLTKHGAWIDEHLKRMERLRTKTAAVEPLSEEELCALAARAKAVIPERVRFYANRIGVTYGRITIRRQRTRWGSCSANGNLSFNCLLMLAPPEVLDSVVVHELCHRKEMNHSKRFYDEVFRAFPEYRKHYQWLKENGALLMARASERD